MTDFTDLYYVHYNPLDFYNGDIAYLPDGSYSKAFDTFDKAKVYFDSLLPNKIKGVQLLITTPTTYNGCWVDNPLFMAD